jgi:cysteinyl-tRNA synthetase, unknown class
MASDTNGSARPTTRDRAQQITIAAVLAFAIPDVAALTDRAQAQMKPQAKSKVALTTKQRLAATDSWGYQLQQVRPLEMAKDGFDILVIDYSADGSEAGRFSREEVAAVRDRPGLADRLVLAYLSIGEAEEYRYYWQASWVLHEQRVASSTSFSFRGAPDGRSFGVPSTVPLATATEQAPPWLAGENPEWRGNYLVRYWDPEWRSLIFGSAEAYLDKIIDAGFDGVYLDKIDANDDWQKVRPSAEGEMVDFVKKISAYAHGRQPGFLIVPQNAEELLMRSDYLKAIDAIAKEDLLFGSVRRKDGVANPESEIRKSKRLLDRARRAGKPVLAVEYLDDVTQVPRARKRLLGYRYIPLFAKRELNEVPANAAQQPPVRP